MLEEYVAFYLEKYLGKYVKGVSKEALKISAWQGNVELTNMQLKPEALNDLKLPVKVKAGFLGSVKLKIPWSRLGQEPVIVFLDRIFILAEPAYRVEGGDDTALQESKQRHVNEAERSFTNSLDVETKKPVDNSWLGSLISTIIGNLKLSITNIHIRYEDAESNPGYPFAAGITLEKLAAVTVDESGHEIFVTVDALDKIQKLGELRRMAVYFNPESKPWDKSWANMSPSEWSEVFEPGILIHGLSADKQNFLLHPVDGTAKYTKVGAKDARSPDKPAQIASILLDDVTLSLSELQYRDVLKLADNMAAFSKRVQYAHYRPQIALKENKRAWWQYAYKAVRENLRKASGRLSWEQVLHFAHLRKKYVSLYVSCLLSNPNRNTCDDNEEIQRLDRELDAEVIIQWRILAHTFVNQSRAQNDEKERRSSNRKWWWFGWGDQSDDDAGQPQNLSDEDWQKLNDIIGYREGVPSLLLPGQDPPEMLHTVLDIHMNHNASELLDDRRVNVLKLAAEDIACFVKVYSRTKIIDLKLKSYQISSPEGLLAESAAEIDALNTSFTYLPMKTDLEWSLTVNAAPCYIMYLKESINRITSFFQSQQAVSREVALQTAVALQTTLEEVARNAQQQINEALKNQPRFSLHLDIAAPKVTIPTNFYPRADQETKLMVDLGHFTLKTEQEGHHAGSVDENELYMHFRICLNDVSAFLVDGLYNWNEQQNDPSRKQWEMLLPILDKCGIYAVVQQICVPHPLLPTTRVALRFPFLGLHMSPSRYHRILQVLDVLQTGNNPEKAARPWDPADFEGELSILAWKGVGNREAIWQHKYGALAGPFLYILESQTSSNSEHHVSLIGKKLYTIPPDCLGGAKHVLAIYDTKKSAKQVAEAVDALLMRFQSEEALENWQLHLGAAIYQVASLSKRTEESNDMKGMDEDGQTDLSSKEIVFLTGVLDDLRVFVSSTRGDAHTEDKILLGKEDLLLELRALGSKVEFSMRQHSMAIGAVLHSLEVENKLLSEEMSSCHFLVRSDVAGGEESGLDGKNIDNGVDDFFDSSEELDDPDNPGTSGHLSRTFTPFYDASDYSAGCNGATETPLLSQSRALLPHFADNHFIFDGIEKHDGTKAFVKVQVVLCSADSPAYRNVDKHVNVSLATLSFFCHRPTVIAVLDLVSDINAKIGKAPKNEASDTGDYISRIDPNAIETIKDEHSSCATFGREDSVVKGLLGRGKSRIVFLLNVDMKKARIVLNLDQGDILTVLDQEILHMEIKLFPSSFGMIAALGNLRITDGSLQSNHPYACVCDMRDPKGTSFVRLEFCTFNPDDNDYEGYEYSLVSKLSEVRIVYLHRFVQEISSYFMGLVPENSDYIVKLKDRVANVDKLFTQSEIEGSPAIKLHLTLNKPMIIFPCNSHSRDFLELDILHISVENTVEWFGGDKNELAALRLETDILQVENIHLTVGINGETGQGIIHEANGLQVIVRRALRDLLHQVPAVDAAIMVTELKAFLSDKEYQVIVECMLGNLSEHANLPPRVAPQRLEATNHENRKDEEDASDTADSLQPPVEQPSSKSVWVAVKVTLDISLLELGLFVGQTKGVALASIEIKRIWLSFKLSTNDETFIMVSLESLDITDDREGISAEIQHIVGKSVVEGSDDEDYSSAVTMIILDAKLTSDSQVITLRLQRPRLLVALDFLLAVSEFFVPSLSKMVPKGSGNGELPFDMNNWIFLRDSYYKQSKSEVSLSPKKLLVADCEGVDEHVYDGGGGCLCLLDNRGERLSNYPDGPLIVIGQNKKLRFKNLTIENAKYLEWCILLGSNSSYSVLESDNVVLREYTTHDAESPKKVEGKNAGEKGNEVVDLTFDLQALGPELLFYTAPRHDIYLSESKDRLLHARMDVFSRLMIKAEDMEVTGKVNGLTIESYNGDYILEPVDIDMQYSMVAGKQNAHVGISDLVVRLSFSCLKLISNFQEDVLSFLSITSKQMVIQCSEFDKIWADEATMGSSQLAFWHPKVPPGFVTLGDCLTLVDEPPSKPVIAVNLNFVQTKKPLSYEAIWSSKVPSRISGESSKDDVSCSVWFPVAPPGFISLGCIACKGLDSPKLKDAFCISSDLVTSWSIKDCIMVPPRVEDGEGFAFWRVDNSLGSFIPMASLKHVEGSRAYELRHMVLKQELPEHQLSSSSSLNSKSNVRDQRISSCLSRTVVTYFSLLWWDDGLISGNCVSIWRPVLPPNCVFFGDFVIKGLEPPKMCFVVDKVVNSGLIIEPLNFEKKACVSRCKGLKDVTFWLPIAPPGYVALGCIASPDGSLEREKDLVWCIRNDLVRQAQFPPSSLWSTKDIKQRNVDFSLWPMEALENEANTFLVHDSLSAPHKEMGLCLLNVEASSQADTVAIDGETKLLSLTVYDDFGGLMCPLVNATLSGIAMDLHGTPNCMISTTNFALVASTYRARHDAWEPLIERVEGFIRYSKECLPMSTSSQSQVLLAAVTELNINISTANINLLMQAMRSWNNKGSEVYSPCSKFKQSASTAGMEKQLEIMYHNQLGELLHFQIPGLDNKQNMFSIPFGATTTIKVPRSGGMLSTNIEVKHVNFTIVRIVDAEVSRDGEICGRQYMAAARIIPQMHVAGGRQLQYQSTRTRCVDSEKASNSSSILLRWDEMFFFETELKEPHVLEIVVSDLSRGMLVGGCSVPLEENTEVNVDPFPVTTHDAKWYQLQSPREVEVSDDRQPCGKIRIATGMFSIGGHSAAGYAAGKKSVNSDAKIVQVAFSADGPWTKLRVDYASNISYFRIGNDIVASEMTTNKDAKHFTLRTLVVVKNGTKLMVDVSASSDADYEMPVALLSRSNSGKEMEYSQSSLETSAVEEVFENERYQPMFGWGSSWPGHLLPTDPGRWSQRDLTGSSQEFPQPVLPLGWEWTSDWYVDRSGPVDESGWIYAFDFRSLMDWDAMSMPKRSFTFVRRRRWVREMKKVVMNATERNQLGSLQGGKMLSLPIEILRPNTRDHFVQFRYNCGRSSADCVCQWTQVVSCENQSSKRHSMRGGISIQSLLRSKSPPVFLLRASDRAVSKARWFLMESNFRNVGYDAYFGTLREVQLLLTAPIMVVNLLPASINFSISENSYMTGFVVQDECSADSGKDAEIFGADLQKPLYFSCVTSGWVTKKDPVLISHSLWELASCIKLRNDRSNRKVKVRIDYENEGKQLAKKVLRLSVPYWLDSSTCPCMRLRILGMKNGSANVLSQHKVGTEEGIVVEEVDHIELQSQFSMLSSLEIETMSLSIALVTNSSSYTYGPSSNLAGLKDPGATVEVKAVDGNGLYFRILASLSVCPLKSAPTKIISLRPYVTFTNRIGEPMFLKQKSKDQPKLLQPFDRRKSFLIPEDDDIERIQIRLENTRWSCPLEITKEEILHMGLLKEDGSRISVRIEVRGYEEGSRFIVIFRRGQLHGPYRLENHMPHIAIRVRQHGIYNGGDNVPQILHPRSSIAFAWDDPHGHELLEVLPDDENITTLPSDTNDYCYDISVSGFHQPRAHASSLKRMGIYVLPLREIKVVKFLDMDVQDGSHQTVEQSLEFSLALHDNPKNDILNILASVRDLSFSLIDQRPQELLLLYMEGVSLSILNSFQESTQRIAMNIGYFQLDNQQILSTFPVIFAPESPQERTLIRGALATFDDRSNATKIFPFIGLTVAKTPWLVNIHEPTIWNVVDMYSFLHLDFPHDSDVIAVDPEIRIDLIYVSEVIMKLTLKAEPGQRPRGVLGMWSPVVTALGNTSKMSVSLSRAFQVNRCMRQSAVLKAVVNHIRRDLVHQVLQLLLGFNVLGVASSTVGTLSRRIADASHDRRFQRLRSKQERLKNISGISAGLSQGGEALARGFAFGITGIWEKPTENARNRGIFGFVQGLGKAMVGFATQPVSGVLDFISLTLNGLNISCLRCFESLHRGDIIRRVRLPRAIHSDGVLCPYDEAKALGQALMQLAEADNAVSDFYDEHFELPDNKFLVNTNKHIMLLEYAVGNLRKHVLSLTRPTICWVLQLAEILYLEVQNGNEQCSSLVILHTRNDPNAFKRVIKCFPKMVDAGKFQADAVYRSIKNSCKKYVPSYIILKSQELHRSRLLPTPRVSKRMSAIDCGSSSQGIESPREATEPLNEEQQCTLEVVLFDEVWSSERDASASCSVMVHENPYPCTIWRPVMPDGYISVGDIAHVGTTPPMFATVYKDLPGAFSRPLGFDLIWRNWRDGFEPITVWKPIAAEGFVALGCVAVAGYVEPSLEVMRCAKAELVDESTVDMHPVWQINKPWHCTFNQVGIGSLSFIASVQDARKNLRPRSLSCDQLKRFVSADCTGGSHVQNA